MGDLWIVFHCWRTLPVSIASGRQREFTMTWSSHTTEFGGLKPPYYAWTGLRRGAGMVLIRLRMHCILMTTWASSLRFMILSITSSLSWVPDTGMSKDLALLAATLSCKKMLFFLLCPSLLLLSVARILGGYLDTMQALFLPPLRGESHVGQGGRPVAQSLNVIHN